MTHTTPIPGMYELTPKAYSYTRFSSPQQSAGDSQRRQNERVEHWIKTEGGGLPLDDSLRDRGVPGYMGRNAKKGALSHFLKAIDTGLVAPGSVLVVENLDRLSRDQPMNAMRLLETICNAGVDVVTLTDGKRYTKANMARDVTTLMTAFLFSSRAHEESATKADRLCKTWAQKRKAAREGVIVSTRVPPWLKVVGAKLNGSRRDRTNAKIILQEDRADVVRRMFEWSTGGMGYRKIVLKLKAEKVAPWGRAPSWSSSSVAKILTSRATYGLFQPCIYEGGAYGKRKPDGPAIRDYYPAVISEAQWEAAQSGIVKKSQGRPSTTVLRDLVFDHLNRRMQIFGLQHKYYKTAVSDLKPGDSDCQWSERHLPEAVRAVVAGVDWTRVFSDKSIEPEKKRLRDEVAACVAEAARIQSKIVKLVDALTNDDDGAFADAFQAKKAELQTQLAAVKAKRTTALARLEELARTTPSAGVTAKTVPTDPAAKERLNHELKSILKKIQVYPDGLSGAWKKAFAMKKDEGRWKRIFERAMEEAPARAAVAKKSGRVFGAIRLFLQNDKAVTAFVTLVRGDRRDPSQSVVVLGFADPVGFTLSEWESWCSHISDQPSDDLVVVRKVSA